MVSDGQIDARVKDRSKISDLRLQRKLERLTLLDFVDPTTDANFRCGLPTGVKRHADSLPGCANGEPATAILKAERHTLR